MSKVSARKAFFSPTTGGNPVAIFQPGAGTIRKIDGALICPSGYIKSAALFQKA